MMNFFSSFVSWEALGIYAIAGAGAIAWFVPFLRRYMIGFAGLVGGLLFIYSKGKRDERRRQQEASKRATQHTLQRQEDARRSAERDVARGVPPDPRDRSDI